MEPNEIFREQIFEVINNQLKNNDPPETKMTYNRLKKEGFKDFQARQWLGKCLLVENYDAIKHGKSNDN